MDEKYFNLHGGGPGKAPAMTKDFRLKDGKASFDKFSDRDCLARENVKKQAQSEKNADRVVTQ